MNFGETIISNNHLDASRYWYNIKRVLIKPRFFNTSWKKRKNSLKIQKKMVRARSTLDWSQS